MMVDDIHHFLKVTREKGKLQTVNQHVITAAIKQIIIENIHIRSALLVEEK